MHLVRPEVAGEEKPPRGGEVNVPRTATESRGDVDRCQTAARFLDAEYGNTAVGASTGVYESPIRVNADVRAAAGIDSKGHHAARAGAVPVSEARLDGIDLLPILEGHAAEVERTLFWRVIDERSQRAVRSGNMKLLLDGELTLLFDLESDISERENLVSDRPDVARELRRLLEEWEQEVDTEAGVE